MAELTSTYTIPFQQLLKSWCNETVFNLKTNFQVQHIWPTEVYPGYKEVNEYNRQHGGWYSTGEGVNSFKGQVLDSTLENATIMFLFNKYLQFVDLGVGRWEKAKDVEHDSKANYLRRYTTWQPKFGESHRPAMMMEFNHVQDMMAFSVKNRFGSAIGAEIFKSVDVSSATDNDIFVKMKQIITSNNNA